jgi:hypothetical protein
VGIWCWGDVDGRTVSGDSLPRDVADGTGEGMDSLLRVILRATSRSPVITVFANAFRQENDDTCQPRPEDRGSILDEFY